MLSIVLEVERLMSSVVNAIMGGHLGKGILMHLGSVMIVPGALAVHWEISEL